MRYRRVKVHAPDIVFCLGGTLNDYSLNRSDYDRKA